MIGKKELNETIAELENARNHTPGMCARLANLYVIRDKLFGEPAPSSSKYGYSMSSGPMPISTDHSPRTLDLYGNSDFFRAINGKEDTRAWAVIDDLMDTLKVVNPRVYESYIAKIKNL